MHKFAPRSDHTVVASGDTCEVGGVDAMPVLARRAMLGSPLRDEDAYALSQGSGYTGPFQQLCREVHAELAATRTTNAVDPA